MCSVMYIMIYYWCAVLHKGGVDGLAGPAMAGPLFGR